MATLKSTGQVTITKILNAVTAALTNNPVSVYAESNGTVTDYTKTSTGIYVYEGPNQLMYNATGTTKGTWRVASVSAVGITPGGISDGGGYALTANHSAMTADNAQIVYTLVGLNSVGESFSLNIAQNLSKTKTGSNGQTTYTWIVYADTAAGDGISRSSANKRYMGIAVNKTTTAPSDNDLLNPAQFSWSPLYENVEVGGKNLIYYSDTLINSTTQKMAQYNLVEEWIPGREYTLSLYSNTKNLSIGIRRDESSSYTPTIPLLIYDGIKDRYTLTFTAPEPTPGDVTRRKLSIFNQSFATNPNVSISRIQLEKGNVVTDWTPAVEDLQSKIINPNILKGSGDYNAFKSDLWIYNTSKAEKTLAQGFISFKALNTTTSTYLELPIEEPTISNETYTLSGKIEASTVRTITIVGRDASNNVVTLLSLPIQNANQRQLFSISFKTPYNLTKIGFTADSIPVVGNTLTVEWLKLEKGVFATSWIAHVNDGILWQNYTTTALNGKNHIFWQSTQPTYGMIEGDIWYNTATLNNGVGGGIYRYTSGTWQEYKLGSNAIAELAIQNAHIAELDAAKIMAHTITALQIKTGSLTADDVKAGILADVAGKNSINLTSGDFSLGNGALTYNAGTGALNLTANSIKIGATSVATTTYADGKASTAENNAKTYTNTKTTDTLNDAKADATAKASAAELAAKTYTDTEISTVNGVIATKVSTTTYNAGIGSKEDTIYKQSTAPAHAAGRLWLDTTTTPNVLKRSTGSAWVKVTPTTAAEVGAYSSSDGSALAGRITTAESNITQQAGQIASKVEQSTYNTKIGLLESSISTVTQTANSVKMAFENQVIGGENLIRESHKLSDKFAVYQGSTISMARDNEPVPEWDTENATVIATSSSGTTALKARWEISKDLTFMADKPMVFSIYAKNNRSDVAVTIGTNRIGEPITLAPLEMRKLEFIGVAPGNEGKFLILELYAPTSAYYLNVTLFHPKWELGDKVTEWSQHPDELYTGYTTINKEGVEVSRSNSDIKSKLAYDGVTVTNGTENIAVFGETTYMPYANIDNIDSLDVVGTVRESMSLQIGEGKDYSTVSEALDAIFKGGRTTLLYDTNINLYLNGNITDEIILKGIEGNGRIYIWFKSGARLYGRIWARDCKVRIYIRSEVTTGTRRGLVKNTTSEVKAIWNESSSYVNVISVNVDGNGKTHGIIGNDAGETSIQDCDIINCENAITSNFGSDVRVMNCKGSNNSRGLRIQTNATMYVTGTYPNATSSAVLILDAFYFPNGTPVTAPSAFSPPTVTDKPFSKTFAPSYLKTQTPDGQWSTYYGDKAAQNRWKSSSPLSVGLAAFGSDVKAYIDDRKSGTTPTIEIRLRRSAISHGSSNAIAPDPNNFTPTTSFTGATLGAWTNWAKVPMSLFTSTGFTFKFGTSKTDMSYNPYRYYAIWDKCEVRISKIKSV